MTHSESPNSTHPERLTALILTEPELGGALADATRTFAEESAVECRFDTPVADRDRAAVKWGRLARKDYELALSGTTVLRFDGDGHVVDHIDYWVERTGRRVPFTSWGTSCPRS